MEKDGGTGSPEGVIPYFFYDVISSIIPGAWLIIAGFWNWYGDSWSEWLFNLPEWIGGPKGHEVSEAALSVMLGTLFILFLGASSVAGFLLAALSHQSIERFWRLARKYSMDGLKSSIGIEGVTATLCRAFEKSFGVSLTENGDLEKLSFLCSYYVWAQSKSLGIMTARFDAQKLAAQSCMLLNLLLFAEVLLRIYSLSGASWKTESLWSVFFLVCAISSGFSFDYHRRKRVYGRFQAFLALAKSERHIDE